jgi:hypothetical protein
VKLGGEDSSRQACGGSGGQTGGEEETVQGLGDL